MKLSIGLKTALLGSGSIDSVMNDFYIHIFKGPVPATADEALDLVTLHTRLAILSLANAGVGAGNELNFGTAASGSIPKDTGVWSGYIRSDGVDENVSDPTTHVPTFLRVCNNVSGTPDNGESTGISSTLRMQLTCGNVGSYEIYVPDMIDNGDGGAGDNVQGFSVFDVRVDNT